MSVRVPVVSADGKFKGVVVIAPPAIIAPVPIPTNPTPVTRPTGAGITLWESTTAGKRITARVTSGGKYSFLSGTFGDPDFIDPAVDPVYMSYVGKVALWAGSGIDKTIFAMPKGTSTRASKIPVQAPPYPTNQYTLFRFDGTPTIQDMTFLGTDQPIDPHTGLPHCYNGIQLYKTTGAIVQRVKVRGIRGTAAMQPGESFGVNDYDGIGNKYYALEVDGAGIGASGVGLNGSSGTYFQDCWFHDNPVSAGITAYQSSNMHYVRIKSEKNHLAFNFERTSGTVTMDQCTMTKGAVSHHITCDSDSVSPNGCTLIINDPTYDGPKLVVLVHGGKVGAPNGYAGNPQTQNPANIHVLRNGKDVSAAELQIISG